MALEAMLQGHRDAVTVRKVFGDPYEKDGITVIPAARVLGMGGGGEGQGPEGFGGTGMGSGFAIAARPAGAYVIRQGEATWQPAIDVNRIIAGAFSLAALALVLAHRSRSRGR